MTITVSPFVWDLNALTPLMLLADLQVCFQKTGEKGFLFCRIRLLLEDGYVIFVVSDAQNSSSYVDYHRNDLANLLWNQVGRPSRWRYFEQRIRSPHHCEEEVLFVWDAVESQWQESQSKDVSLDSHVGWYLHQDWLVKSG
jgi:hypothetical protein